MYTAGKSTFECKLNYDARTQVPSKGISVKTMCSILRQRVQQEDEDTSFVFKAVSLRVLPDFTNRGDVLLRDIIKYVSLKTTHSLKNIIHCDIYIHILKRRYSSQDNCAIVSLAETIGDIVRITKCDAPNVQSSAVTALAA